MQKPQLLERLRAGRAEWEKRLAAIGPERLTQPGAAGEWSVRDVIAHVTAYEQCLVDWLQAARRGDFPAACVLDTPGVEARNAATHARTRALPLAEVQAAAARNFQALLDVLEQFPEWRTGLCPTYRRRTKGSRPSCMSWTLPLSRDEPRRYSTATRWPITSSPARPAG